MTFAQRILANFNEFYGIMLMTLITGCGGMLNDARGIITVRRRTYTDCVWLLSAPVGSQIMVRRTVMLLSMSPLRRHSFALWQKGFFFGPSSVKRGRTHLVLG